MTGRGGRQRLRVAVVTGSYNFIADGVALTLNRLVAYLERAGVEVLVVAPVGRSPAFQHHGELAPAPSAPLPFRPEYRLTLGLTPALRRRLEAFDPDIVHIATPDLLGRQAQAFAQTRGRPAVASYHTRYETYLKDYGLGFLEDLLGAYIRRFYAACDEVYVPSASMIASLKADGFADNIHLWGRGVDTERFNPARRNTAFRARLRADDDMPVVAFVGRLVREKRLDTMIQTAERLADVPHRLLIVGEGPDRPMLERALPEAIFTGYLSGDELAVAYASSDIFLFPSDTETFGSVTLEAMASALPAVCADATGSRSLVEQDVTGYLVPPGDSDAFAARVRVLASQPELRGRMGAAARERSLTFAWEADMAGLLARYEALAAGARRAVA